MNLQQGGMRPTDGLKRAVGEIRNYDCGPCETSAPPMPLFDDALERLHREISEYKSIIDSINSVAFGAIDPKCNESMDEDPKVINIIRRLTDNLATNNKQLYGIRDNLRDYFGQLKL